MASEGLSELSTQLPQDPAAALGAAKPREPRLTLQEEKAGSSYAATAPNWCSSPGVLQERRPSQAQGTRARNTTQP